MYLPKVLLAYGYLQAWRGMVGMRRRLNYWHFRLSLRAFGLCDWFFERGYWLVGILLGYGLIDFFVFPFSIFVDRAVASVAFGFIVLTVFGLFRYWVFLGITEQLEDIVEYHRVEKKADAGSSYAETV